MYIGAINSCPKTTSLQREGAIPWLACAAPNNGDNGACRKVYVARSCAFEVANSLSNTIPLIPLRK